MAKKGASEMWWIIMTAIIVVVVLILILVWFKGGAGKLFDGLGERTKGLADCDKDNVADLFDKCKCDPSVGDELPKSADGKDIPADQVCSRKCENKDTDCVK